MEMSVYEESLVDSLRRLFDHYTCARETTAHLSFWYSASVVGLGKTVYGFFSFLPPRQLSVLQGVDICESQLHFPV